MDFIANRIQPKIAGLSYVVIQSHFLQIKLIGMKGCGESRREEKRGLLLEIFSIRTHSLSIYNSTRKF